MKSNTKVLILIVVLLLTVGFAAVTTNLLTNGTVFIGTGFHKGNVYFKDVNMINGTYNLSQDKKSITFNTELLTNVGDEATLNYLVINENNQYDANVSISIQNNSTVNNVDYSSYYSITTEGFNPGEEVLLKSMNEKTGRIIIKLLKIPTENVSLTIVVELEIEPIELEEEGKLETKLLYDVIASSLTRKEYNNFDVGKVDTLSQLSNPKKIYYELEENTKHIIFANKCWTLLRTTETGGTKIMYNGEAENGQCLDGRDEFIKGNNRNINSNYPDNYLMAYSYMYNDNPMVYMDSIIIWSEYNSQAPYYYDVIASNNYTYNSNTNTYTLSGNTQRIYKNNTGSQGNLEDLGPIYKYTCGNTNTTCNELREIIYGMNGYLGTHYDYFSLYDYFYIILSNNSKNLNELLNDNNINQNDSKAKEFVESWFENNIINYQDQLEDIYMCNDRSLGINVNNNGIIFNNHIFNDIQLLNTNTNIVNYLSCPRSIDIFSVSNTQAMLKYSIGLPSIAELHYMDPQTYNIPTEDYGLTNTYPLTSTPSYIFDYGDNGTSYRLALGGNNYEIRPVISLKSDILISSGSGTTNDPYIIS